MKSIAEVLAQAPGAPLPQDPQMQNPFMPNQGLEQRVAQNVYPVNPLVLAIAHKLGLFNMIRNTQNEKQDLLQQIDQQVNQ